MYQTNEYIDSLHHELVSAFYPEQHAHFHGRELLVYMRLLEDLLGCCFFFFGFESVFACSAEGTLPIGR